MGAARDPSWPKPSTARYHSSFPVMHSRVFDLDPAFAKDAGFVRFDFNTPEALPADLHGIFDLVLPTPSFPFRASPFAFACSSRCAVIPRLARRRIRNVRSPPARLSCDSEQAMRRRPVGAGRP